MTTILVIDDRAEVGEVITRIFAETEMMVLTATSGPAGLALAAARDPLRALVLGFLAATRRCDASS